MTISKITMALSQIVIIRRSAVLESLVQELILRYSEGVLPELCYLCYSTDEWLKMKMIGFTSLE